MTNIDQFESAFKSADKTPLALEQVHIRNVLVATDLSAEEATQLTNRLKTFLDVLNTDGDPMSWHVLTGDQFSTVGQLLAKLGEAAPDLVCTYRNLHAPVTEHPYSLGVYVDVLAQATSHPVLVVPNPHVTEASTIPTATDTVMAITDHLAGEHHLVSIAAALTRSNGTLWLTHVEDAITFERYMATIGKVPTIDTDTARQAIMDQLLKEPRDYIQSCRNVLREHGRPFDVEEIVTVGHRLRDYKSLIESHDVDLLVLNTKDQDQLAMHGLAFPLSVEFRQTPILML